MQTSVSVCVCVCPPPRLLKEVTSSTAFQFLYMTLAMDITDGWGLSNEARRELLPKKTKVMLFITNKTVLKVGVPCGLQSL